ncbi:hypothetical protein F4677DRAFT_299556 [Hypoxylon crocopeplum]|nr:hypothetical protein F4677DRAFT_299556 [Hypoxylon crocopeplum]
MATTTTPTAPLDGLLRLPKTILAMLPDYLYNIEDYTNLSATCRTLKECMETASPATILQLAWASTRVFFRPSPHFLVCAVARQLGFWARESDENEAELAAGMPRGIDHLMDLALKVGCGLPLPRIRELYELRFSLINRIADVIDKCVGYQWWLGVIDGDTGSMTDRGYAPMALWQLAIYGELFGPDFDPFLDPENFGH